MEKLWKLEIWYCFKLLSWIGLFTLDFTRFDYTNFMSTVVLWGRISRFPLSWIPFGMIFFLQRPFHNETHHDRYNFLPYHLFVYCLLLNCAFLNVLARKRTLFLCDLFSPNRDWINNASHTRLGSRRRVQSSSALHVSRWHIVQFSFQISFSVFFLSFIPSKAHNHDFIEQSWYASVRIVPGHLFKPRARDIGCHSAWAPNMQIEKRCWKSK